ncbi:MAG: radical SAM protein [Thermodesulfobacteriota bacterium]|nr:radical SAM protein [Thermodesulfobacteriota bacterium]
MAFLFGPVSSRRLGLSLGIDLLPPKICTFDCIYCEIGRTTLRTAKRKEYVPTSEVLKEAENYLQSEAAKIDYVTVTASGEPTLHSKIGDIVSRLKDISPKPVAVITNSSLLHLPEVRQALLKADVILPSLDAVRPDTFRRINRPIRSIRIEQIISGLKDLRQEYTGRIWLEILFVQGINDRPEEVEELRKALKAIQPDRIQLNTVDRPPAEDYAAPLSSARLETIREVLGERAEVIVDFKRRIQQGFRPLVESEILAMLARRPCTVEDISGLLNVSQDEISAVMESLIKKHRAQYKTYDQRVFYIIPELNLDLGRKRL